MRICGYIWGALALALVGCHDEPVGLAPGQYCAELEAITGHVADECAQTQERIQRERPDEYECMSNCVHTSSDVASFTTCTERCN